MLRGVYFKGFVVVLFLIGLISLVVSGRFTPNKPFSVRKCIPRNLTSAAQMTINVVSILGGDKYINEYIFMVKSIVIKTQNPLHFHIITDSKTQEKLVTLFTSWDITGVRNSFYNVEEYIPNLQWIPTHHYAGYYTLVKLPIPEILPNDVDKVILLDVDAIFLVDIVELWGEFQYMENGSYIAMTRDMNELHRQWTKWPMMQNGFNSGVMLLNLFGLRNNNYNELWKQTAKKYLGAIGEPSVGEQDVLNALVANNPDMLHILPPEYNVQIGWIFPTVENLVPVAKVIHRNNPEKILKYPSFTELYEDIEKMTAVEVNARRLVHYNCV